MGQLALEVIGGPMDGVRCNLVNNILIGRKIGSELPLTKDRKVSNPHASIQFEGNAWCLYDCNSKNGTKIYSEGKKQKVDYKYPVELYPGQIIVVGSTIIEVLRGSDNSDIYIKDEFYINPGDIFSMTTELKKIWSIIIEKAKDERFCEINSIFEAIVENDPSTKNRFSCVENICSKKNWRCLPISKLSKPSYDLKKDKVLSSPRIWRILEIASECNTIIGLTDVLQAILYEGKSIAYRYMIEDKLFIKHFALTVPQKNIKEQNFVHNDYNSCEDKIRDDLWKNYLLQFENIILEALKMTGQDSYLKHFPKELIDIPSDNQSEITKYMEKLNFVLGAIIAAYKTNSKVLGATIAAHKTYSKELEDYFIEHISKTLSNSIHDEIEFNMVLSCLKDNEGEDFVSRILQKRIDEVLSQED